MGHVCVKKVTSCSATELPVAEATERDSNPRPTICDDNLPTPAPLIVYKHSMHYMPVRQAVGRELNKPCLALSIRTLPLRSLSIRAAPSPDYSIITNYSDLI